MHEKKNNNNLLPYLTRKMESQQLLTWTRRLNSSLSSTTRTLQRDIVRKKNDREEGILHQPQSQRKLKTTWITSKFEIV